MTLPTTLPSTARQAFRARLEQPQPLFVPLCLDALSARIVEAAGFAAGYVSGGALGYANAVSEALLTLDELVSTTRHVTQRSNLPVIVDGGVGFGDAVHLVRAIWEVEATGAAAIEIEDQVAPKRVSHHRGVEHLISCGEMVAKIQHAVAARRDPDFLIIARTGAVRNESYAAAVVRANAYRAAGADMILLLPGNDDEWRRAPADIAAPLVAMAALDARSAEEWRTLGWRVIIDPFTAQVIAVSAVRDALLKFQKEGNTGHAPADIFRTYRHLADWAGLEALYDIERATTERASVGPSGAATTDRTG